MFDPDALDMGTPRNAEESFEAAFVFALALNAALGRLTGDEEAARGALWFAVGPTVDPMDEAEQ